MGVTSGSYKLEVIPCAQSLSTSPLIVFFALGDPPGVRRLAKIFSGTWDVALLERSEATADNRHDPFLAEHQAELYANAIRQVLESSGASAVLVGYCFGGLLAQLTASRLGPERCCRLILIDTPVPGHPYPLMKSRALTRSFRYWHTLFRLRRRGELTGTSRFALTTKVAWHAVRVSRALLRPVWHTRALQDLLQKTARNDYQLQCTIGPIGIPLLHIVVEEESYFPAREARLGWEDFARSSYTLKTIVAKHEEMFFRPNLPKLDSIIREWMSQ